MMKCFPIQIVNPLRHIKWSLKKHFWQIKEFWRAKFEKPEINFRHYHRKTPKLNNRHRGNIEKSIFLAKLIFPVNFNTFQIKIHISTFFSHWIYIVTQPFVTEEFFHSHVRPENDTKKKRSRKEKFQEKREEKIWNFNVFSLLHKWKLDSGKVKIR